MSKRTREQLIRANEQRIHLKTLTRKANFIAEYVEIKYANVYSEALHFFDTLNAAHPVKSDLRKTKEFRDWKTYMKGEPPKKRQKPMYNYVKNAPEQYEKQRQQLFQESGSLCPQSTDQEPKSLWLQASNEEPESPRSQTPQGSERMPSPATDNPGTPQTPQTPQGSERMPSPATDNPGTPQTPQTPQGFERMPSPATDNPGTPQTPQTPQGSERMPSPATDNPGTPQTPQTPQGFERMPSPATPRECERYKDNMILRIPLLQSPQNSTPFVTTETVEIITEQLEPFTFDDIPPQRMEELITELQKDPDINALFDDLQAQTEFQELGLDIDIDENYPLENELEFW